DLLHHLNQRMLLVGSIGNFESFLIFQQIARFAQVVELFSDSIGALLHLSSQPSQIAFISRIDKKFYQQPQSGFRCNNAFKHKHFSFLSNKSTQYFESDKQIVKKTQKSKNLLMFCYVRLYINLE